MGIVGKLCALFSSCGQSDGRLVSVNSYKCPYCGKLFEEEKKASDHIAFCERTNVRCVSVSFGFDVNMYWTNPASFFIRHCHEGDEAQFDRVDIKDSYSTVGGGGGALTRTFTAYANGSDDVERAKRAVLAAAYSDIDRMIGKMQGLKVLGYEINTFDDKPPERAPEPPQEEEGTR